jgi:glycosyltransferase involved in cell wall biosynthesis
MRIVHVINSLGFGGAERQLSLLLPVLAEQGVKQRVIPLVKADSGVHVPPHALLSGAGRWQPFKALLHAMRCARKRDTVLVAWMYHSWLVAFIAHMLGGRQSKIFFYCRHGNPATLRLSTRLLAIAMLWVARSADIAVVFNSGAAMQMHLGLVPGLRGELISNAVEETGLGKSGRTETIGFLGRNHLDKGADRVANIACQLLQRLPSSWKFVAAGPGMPERRIEMMEAAEANGIDPRRILVQDAVKDVPNFMLAVDLLIAPSRTESFPNVLAEAMMLRIPVSAMDVGGVRELLAGLIEPSDDIDGLVETAVNLCLADNATYFELGEALRSAVHHRYGVLQVARNHIGLWEDALT